MQSLVVAILLLAGSLGLLTADPIITYHVTSIAGGYQYNYSFSGLSLLNNQELDISFDPALYGQISNGVAPGGYDLLLFQPNVPPAAPGEYSLLATVDNPTTVGTFSVQFTYLGPGAPSSQNFAIYDDNAPLHLLASGVTVAGAPPAIPEPSSLWLGNIGMILVTCRGVAVRRRAGRKISRTTA